MKITQIRENGDTEALSVTDIDLLIEKMKKETKLRPVTGLRQAVSALEVIHTRFDLDEDEFTPLDG